MENVDQQEQELDLTPEQLTERKEQMLSFYTESLPYLEAQLKYESLLHVALTRHKYRLYIGLPLYGNKNELY